jgi:hypothetical protein
MGKATVLSGACLKLYLNNKLYKEVQEVSYVLDYDEQAIRGIDSPYPQEIAPGRASCAGSVRGIRIKYSGGIQAYNVRPLIKDILSSPYISIRIQDRSTKEDILFIPNAKIKRQAVQGTVKGIVRISFDFEGLVGFEPLDRA